MTVYSTVRVINLTPHPTSEIKTSVITFTEGAFRVPGPGITVNSISVSSDYDSAGYVQWEPMGDLYPPSQGCPLGSYKTIRVKWDCKLPAGSNRSDYAVGGTTHGPYAYYSETLFNFVDTPPATTPSFNLTNGVKYALGMFNNDPLKFQFSGHGYVNEFSMLNGLYGQDIQRDYPNGSATIPAFRDPIYARNTQGIFGEVGSVTESPKTLGTPCLAKEYELHGRIVPELDVSAPAFDPETWDTSGNDAPPFWYNFNYELQHEKNVIPFTFMWGVGMLNYDQGDYDPRGISKDLQDVRSNHYSNNHGPRIRSIDYLQYLADLPNQNTTIFATPNNFYSEDDITFSIVGAETVCHASSVNVCAVSTDTYNGLTRTIINWFDKANADIYDIKMFGINNLPSHFVWVLRGCLLLNDSYVPGNILGQLPQEQINAQRSIRQERTWAIDVNFRDRRLFGTQKNTAIEPPESWVGAKGYANSYQTASYLLYNLWDSTPITVRHPLFPGSLASQPTDLQVTYYDQNGQQQILDLSQYQNIHFGNSTPYVASDVQFLKGLREPWATSPLGLATRPGIPGSQPGFSNVGGAGVNAAIGHPDMRAWEACVDLEWNRLLIEVDRAGNIVDQFDDAWLAKRFVGNYGSISNSNLDRVGKLLVGPNYSLVIEIFRIRHTFLV